MSMTILPEDLRGEGPCADCATEDNIIWFTDEVVWNAIVRPDGEQGDPFLCIPCFVVRVKEAGWNPAGWRVIPEWPWRGIPADIVDGGS